MKKSASEDGLIDRIETAAASYVKVSASLSGTIWTRVQRRRLPSVEGEEVLRSRRKELTTAVELLRWWQTH